MTIKYTKQETLAIETAKDCMTVGNMQSNIDSTCQALHKLLKGKKLGTVKTGDAVMIRFTETLATDQERKMDGKTVILKAKAEQTVKNYATAFRKAVNEGVPFSMNAYRAKAKRGADTSKSDEVKPLVTLKVAKDATASQVAEGIRQAVNDEKFRDKYAELCAFLIDALDEFEGV